MAIGARCVKFRTISQKQQHCGSLFLLFLLMLLLSEAAQLNVTEGDDVTLNCTYTGSLPLPKNPTVIWKSNTGKTLLTTNKTLTHQLLRVTTNDSGLYECHIRDVGYQLNIHLNITAKKTDKVEPTGGAPLSHPSVCFVATLLSLTLYLI